jgi:hypothetical protein
LFLKKWVTVIPFSTMTYAILIDANPLTEGGAKPNGHN